MSQDEMIKNMAETIVLMYHVIDGPADELSKRDLAFCNHFWPQYNQAKRILAHRKVSA